MDVKSNWSTDMVESEQNKRKKNKNKNKQLKINSH